MSLEWITTVFGCKRTLFRTCTHLWHFKFSRRRVWCSELSSGLYCRVKLLSTADVSLKRRTTLILHGSILVYTLVFTLVKENLYPSNSPHAFTPLLSGILQAPRNGSLFSPGLCSRVYSITFAGRTGRRYDTMLMLPTPAENNIDCGHMVHAWSPYT
jgi:hypothetical protein